MGKIKIPRKNPSLDMTAMCDMAFLLLTFFILTAQFKPETPLEVDAPKSSSNKEETDKVLKIIVDTTGTVFLEIKEPKKRAEVLRYVAKHYGLSDKFSEESYKEFAGRQNFGLSMQDLPKVLDAKATTPEGYKKIGIKKSGIPMDTSANGKNNQLGVWILYTNKVYETDKAKRMEEMVINSPEKVKIVKKVSAEGLSEADKKIWEEEQRNNLKVVLFGDQRSQFKVIKQVLNALQERQIYRVHLVTNLRGEGGGGTTGSETAKKQEKK